MSTVIIRNGAPQAALSGTKDVSVPELVQSLIGSPIHLPLSFTFSEEGPEGESHVVSGDSMFKLYGLDITDTTSKYATINTPYIELFNANANEQMIQRLVPDDATQATLRLYAEVVAISDAPIYERAADNSIQYDGNGDPIQTGTGPGIKVVWRVGAIDPVFGDFGVGTTFDGTLTGSDGATSKLYPIIDLPAAARGSKYCNYGIRLACLNEVTSMPVASELVESVGARIFSLQMVEREDSLSTATVISTLDGGSTVNFSFMKDAYYKALRKDYDYKKILLKSYRNVTPSAGYAPIHGSISDFFVYESNLTLLQGLFKAALNDAVELDMIDIFTGLDNEGNMYDSVVVDAGTEGGEVLTMTNAHWLDGGTDGTMSNDTFDALVRREMNIFGEGDVNYLNVLRYPCRFLWDAGYTVDTKIALANFMGRRKDTICVLNTHVYNQGTNDIATENSMKIALQAILHNYPDSSEYGTVAFRGMVVGHSMTLIDHAYTDRVPVSYSLANMTSLYAGASDPGFKSTYRFSRGELAKITEGTDLNLTYKPRTTYESDWDAGLINVMSYDQYTYFFPALYTVYTEDRSILNGYIIAIIVADLNYIATQTWAQMSGASDLSNGQITTMINNKIITATNGRYDGVAQVEPNAYFTAEDVSNGYSVTVDINLYGNVLNTVHKYTIKAYRQED